MSLNNKLAEGQIYRSSTTLYQITYVDSAAINYKVKPFNADVWAPQIGSVDYFNELIYQGEIKLIREGKSDVCQHELKEHIGLIERFKYCLKCDFKEVNI